MQVYDPEFVRLMTGQPEEQAESLRQSAEALSQKIIKEKWRISTITMGEIN